MKRQPAAQDPAPGSGVTPERTPWKAALSWCAHDLANTIYSAVVVTIFLPLYAKEQTGLAWPAGVIATLSMFAAAFVVPVLGGVVDRTGRGKAYLVRTYYAYCLMTLGMSLGALLPGGIAMVLLLFAVANFSYQASLVFYNSLLPVVASPVGMNRCVVADGETGRLATTTEEWVAALDGILEDPTARERMGAAGRARVEADFATEVVAASTAEILKGHAR